MTQDQFFKVFEKHSGRGLFALLAKNSEERSYLLAQLCQRASPVGDPIRLQRVESSRADDVLTALSTPSFTREIEIFVIEEAQLCSQHFLKKLNDFLDSEVKKRHNSNWGVVLSCSEMSRQLGWQALLKKAITLNLCAEKPWAMRLRWQNELIMTARQTGIVLTQNAARLIVERSGNSRFFAQTELEKHLLLAGENGLIDEQFLATKIGHRQDNGIWPLVRAVEQKDVSSVWSAIISLFSTGGGLGAIALMRSHFQTLMICLEEDREPNKNSKELWQQRRDQQRNQSAQALGKRYLTKVLRSLHSADDAQRLGEVTSEELLQAWFLKWIEADE